MLIPPSAYLQCHREGDGDATFTYTQAIEINDRDPSTLCPFCDEKLPEQPSLKLLSMLDKLKRKATPDPRWGNSLGLKAKMETYVAFCALHDAESTELPKGKKYGWPTTLDLEGIARRTWRFQSRLERIINEPEVGTFLFDLQEKAGKYGANAVSGAKGNWAVFNDASTGYYGEQGVAIITQVLFDMFPQISAEKMAPLDRSSYFSLGLVPEAALMLIEEDIKQRSSDKGEASFRFEALRILRKSHKYGLAMFPFQEGEDGDTGDAIIKARLKKMRKIAEDKKKEKMMSYEDGETMIDLSSDSSVSTKSRQRESKLTRQTKDEQSGGHKLLSTNKEWCHRDDSKSAKMEQKESTKRRRRILQPDVMNAGFKTSNTSTTIRTKVGQAPSTSRSKDFTWLLDF
ncbi:hypothetical protein CPB86DRAFT_695647 [Serendipita vermifera]|nr:hypothetical protein CPB86DRAFT_695647 [Serendipita vermifera]